MTLEIALAAAFSFVPVVVLAILFARWYRRAPANGVLIRTGGQGMRVVREGILAIPVVHQIETLDTSTRTIAIDRRKGNGLLAANGDRVELKVTFFVRINDTTEDILAAVRGIGCATLNDPAKFRAHVEPKLASALETVARALDAAEIERDRERFRDQVLSVLGDLGEQGLVVRDLAMEDVRVVPEIAPPYR